MMPSTIPSSPSHKWFRVIVRILVVIVVFVLVSGFVYQSISEARDRRFHPMPGQRIDIGGYKLHINCRGQGGPVVVLDSGLGDSFIVWQKVQPQIAEFTRVCSYDRAGLGYSDSSPHPRTSQVMAQELHTLLHNAGISGPIVLVGHSAGGYNVRVFNSLYRNEVAGMVLVDASHPEQQKRLPPALNDMDATWVREAEFLEFTAPFGLPRLLGFCGGDPAVRATDCTFSSAREVVAELKSISQSAAQTAATGSLGEMPLIVLSHDPDRLLPDLPADLVKPTNEAWEKMQEELAHLSTKGRQTIAKNSSHYIQLDRPELVIDAVRNAVNQVQVNQVQVNQVRPSSK